MQLPQPGDTFESRYQLHEVLGEGGFATVFRATDSARIVAIKILTPGANGYDRDVLSRFRREVEVLAKLRNPHSVRMFEHGESRTGLLYMVFEYVPGEDLSVVLARHGRLSAEATIHVLSQVLVALGEAHGLGLMHRDIKPENIRIFEYMGDPLTVKLLDFGIAKPLVGGEQSSITRAGELVGTPRYMSPEQLTDGKLTPASDLYSVGLVGFEAIMGSEMLPGRALANQLERLQSGHVFSSESYERLSPELDAVLSRMSARRPEDRFQSAQQALAALHATRSGVRVASVAPRPTPPASSPRPDQRRALVVIAAVAGAAVVAIAIAALLMSTPPPAEESAEQKPARRPMPLGPEEPNAPPPEPAKPTAELKNATDITTSSGCASPPPFTATGRLKYMEGLRSYDWTTHVPANYDPNRKYPVVLLFHQDTRSGAFIISQTQIAEVADREGFIVIAPDGSSLPWRDPVQLVNVPLALTVANEALCIDRHRIFAVGHGVGGFAANFLSCEPWIAGIATNSFRARETRHPCESARPVPYMMLSPITSSRIPVEGGGQGCSTEFKIPLQDAEEMWRERDVCTGGRSEHVRDGADVCFAWDCEAAFISCHLHGAHSWPGATVRELDFLGCDGDQPNIKFPGTETILSFFKQLPPNEHAFTPDW